MVMHQLLLWPWGMSLAQGSVLYAFFLVKGVVILVAMLVASERNWKHQSQWRAEPQQQLIMVEGTLLALVAMLVASERNCSSNFDGGKSHSSN